jgi:hypothetical protein
MKRKSLAAALLALALAAAFPSLGSGGRLPQPPPTFFGISPQTELTQADVEYMQAGRIGSLRWPMGWGTIQPTANGGYDWSSFDQVMDVAARGHLRVLPFLYATPEWLTRKPTTLPIDTGRERNAWSDFLRAAVRRYGPGGEFWAEHGPGGSRQPVISNPIPIREWQVWNEANFFYFAKPASPGRYARLLKLSSGVIRSTDPDARIMLSGLFGDPSAKPPNALSAATFLERLYRVPGIKSLFDSVALHPYAEDAKTLEELTEGIREVIVENHDRGARLYITEMGWGSQNDPHVVSFERGIRGQVKELRGAYRYLIANRGRLNLKGTYWFSWKDLPGICNFCDSVGLFHHGEGLRPKPAWHAFVNLTGGRARP